MKNYNTLATTVLLTALMHQPAVSSAQVITDVFDGVGNETYTGTNGFGPFNWVNATNFGFASQQGSNAFLSNYTGLPIPNIGMVKPFTSTMDATTYRVAFHCSRYSSPNTLAFTDYDTLYIGSPNGTMVWDTVPTPSVDYQWVRWSGLYTPAPSDIGEPFKFGFSVTITSGTSFALDGPVTATDISTGITTTLDTEDPLVVFADPASKTVVLRAGEPLAAMELFDAQGHLVLARPLGKSTVAHVTYEGMSAGLFVVRVLSADGTLRAARVVLQ